MCWPGLQVTLCPTIRICCVVNCQAVAASIVRKAWHTCLLSGSGNQEYRCTVNMLFCSLGQALANVLTGHLHYCHGSSCCPLGVAHPARCTAAANQGHYCMCLVHTLCFAASYATSTIRNINPHTAHHQ